MDPIIQIKNIGKKYVITHQRGGYVALRDVLASVAKNPFRFLKHKAKAVVGKGGREEFWALRGVSVDIQQGETIGVIGSNGAGKSTLLKILTGITPPTEGEVILRGRVVSLLEVGTGFHPELSGRENIFLNGAILGMTRKEIADKFSEIVAFAGVERFLDTPVKYYSSGMYVRLAFSVAAHMEPDILLVDEVLAVGDAEFQKKCLGKMGEVTKAQGRTILFVSHNLTAVAAICKKVIVMEAGKMIKYDEAQAAIDFYRARLSASNKPSTVFSLNNGKITLRDFTVDYLSEASVKSLALGLSLESEEDDVSVNVGYGIRRKQDWQLMVFTHAELEGLRLKTQKHMSLKTTFNLPQFAPGEYIIELHVWVQDKLVLTEKEIGLFTIPEIVAFRIGKSFSSFPSLLMTDSAWEVRH